MSLGRKWWGVCSAVVLAAYAVVSLTVRPGLGLSAFGNLTDLVLLAIGVWTTLAAAFSNRGQASTFWFLMSAAFFLWFLNQIGWTWIEVIAHRPLPEPFFGDTVLFIHIVPMIAAVALRPHRRQEERNVYFSTLNFLMLLLWWVFLYMFVIFPDQYVSLNVRVYGRNFDILYLVQNLILIAALAWAYLDARGAWRSIYGNLLIACSLYTLSSHLMDVAIEKHLYHTGSLYDLPYTAGVCWFIWAAHLGRDLHPECEAPRVINSRWVTLAPRLAMLSILSWPIMGFWVLFLDPSPPQLREFRLLVALAAMLSLGFFIFLKQFRLDHDLIRLLDDSQHGYENLQRLQTQLVQREKLASLGRLVAGAAHEINNPLAAILGYSDLLSTNESLSTDQLSLAKKIGQQARRTRDLVSDLLSFSQQASAEKTPVDMAAVLQRAIKMEMLEAEKKKIRIEIKVQPGVPRVVGNANQLLQAALEIIRNAIEALEESGGGQLVVTLSRDGNEVLVQFSDNGPGIRDPQRVFDPFYTTKPIGKGTGLGLSATYGVIEDHQGQIQCHNKPEGGAVFTLRLPIVKSAVLAGAAKA
jgi:signal transduction histidine kinase